MANFDDEVGHCRDSGDDDQKRRHGSVHRSDLPRVSRASIPKFGQHIQRLEA